MKLSWPIYLAISLGSFMLFIGYLVYRTYGVNNDLVSEEYYKLELDYQNRINKMQAASDAGIVVTTERKDSFLIIHFNRPVIQPGTKGTITLYRPSEKVSDKVFPIEIEEGVDQVISVNNLATGWYQLQIDWSNEHASFYIERDLTLQ